MNPIHDEQAAIDLANLVLDMDMGTPKGRLARKLARKVLAVPDAAGFPDLVPIFTNGTLRMIPRSEPVFLLRAQDKHAAGTVRFWAGAGGGRGRPPV